MAIGIRRARASDQTTIVELIRRAHWNSRRIRWECFTVAEDDGRIVGIRQIRPHSGGTREVASGFVLPEYRRRGISSQLMRAVLQERSGRLYLLCDERWTSYYERFGFRRVARRELPADFRREYWMARVVTLLLSVPVRRKIGSWRCCARERRDHRRRPWRRAPASALLHACTATPGSAETARSPASARPR